MPMVTPDPRIWGCRLKVVRLRNMGAHGPAVENCRGCRREPGTRDRPDRIGVCLHALNARRRCAARPGDGTHANRPRACRLVPSAYNTCECGPCRQAIHASRHGQNSLSCAHTSEGAGVSHRELVRQLAQQAYRGATSPGERHSRPTTASSCASERQWSAAGQRVWPLGPTPTSGVSTWQHPQMHASCGPRRAARAKRGWRAPQRT